MSHETPVTSHKPSDLCSKKRTKKKKDQTWKQTLDVFKNKNKNPSLKVFKSLQDWKVFISKPPRKFYDKCQKKIKNKITLNITAANKHAESCNNGSRLHFYLRAKQVWRWLTHTDTRPPAVLKNENRARFFAAKEKTPLSDIIHHNASWDYSSLTGL